MQLENERWQGLQIFSLAIETTTDAIVIGDLDGQIKYVNKAALKMYGTTDQGDILGRNVAELIVERDLERATRSSIQTLTTDKGFVGEYGALKKSGEEFPVEVTIAVLRDETGKEIGFIDIIRDITDRRKAEAELKENEEKYRQLFANMLDGFAYCQIILDELGKPVDFVYLEINDAFECLTGLKRANVIGKRVGEAIPGTIEAHPDLFKTYCRVALTGKSDRFEIEFKPLGIWLSISVYCPKIGYFAAVFENITEQKQLAKQVEEYSHGLEYTVSERTKQLMEAQEQLLKSERLGAIGELAGMVGHDLRNPLSGIKNAAYYLRKKQAGLMVDDGVEMLTMIDSSVEKANKIVNDLLDYSREMRLELEEYSPKSIIVSLLYTIKLPNNVKVSEHVQPFPLIPVDIDKIERVFYNLVNNALEAMPNGGELKIASTQNEDRLELAFTDTGIGMAEGLLEKIFTPLVTTKAKGMGFGLAICKRIVEAHGGKITVRSKLNEGTTFTVSLPMEQKIHQSNDYKRA